MRDDIEKYFQAFIIERPDGSFYLQLFKEKEDAYKFIEKEYNDYWSKIQRKYKLKIVKVEIVKKKWR